MNTIQLTKKLISIPSYVDRNCNEKDIGEFIYKYLKRFPWLIVKKQFVTKERFNVIAKDKAKTKILVCDHMDTVQPQTDWTTSPFTAVNKDGKIFGLGASDTKGNIAGILSAIQEVRSTKGLMYLFYIDEEYDFKGIKSFIQEYKGKIKPQIIASGDGGNLELGNTCRGLIEINFTIKGQAGHSADPKSGNNAIVGGIKAFSNLELTLKREKSMDLGKNTLNLAWIKGGQLTKEKGQLGKEGNVIPDYCQIVIEVRVANAFLNAKKVANVFSQELRKLGLRLSSYTVRHDLGAWITPNENLRFLPVKKKVFTKASKRGYVDLQMLWQAFNKPVCFTFGAGESNVAHKANEYINVEKLEKAEKFWVNFIENLPNVKKL